MTSSSSSTDSTLSEDFTPDCACPRTSPSRRCSRSIRDSSKPSRVPATASSRARAGLAPGMSLTSRQSPGALPRPTRPRSWWSWETPKRSASMMTIAVAFGTFTPTSMTVVATSTSTWPAVKRRITSSLASGCSLPCRISIRRPASGPLASISAVSTTASGGRLSSLDAPTSSGSSGSALRFFAADFGSAGSSSPIRGQTTYAWWPLPTSSRTRSQARTRKLGFSTAGTTWVEIGERPAGSWSRTDVSRSPKTVIATVRGIGVAVITSRCGGCSPLARRASRCSTPKRCCSSTTTRPRSWNWTLSSIRACVPIAMPASPQAMSSMVWRRAAVPIEPVSSATLVPMSAPPSMPPSARSPIISTIERWCCWASTSVGASSTAWPPASTTVIIARSATSVLPEPTSPWSRRCIGCEVARSAKISALTLCWPSVRVNGSRASKASSRPPVRAGRGTAGSAESAARRWARATWRTNASSQRSRLWARSRSAWVCGRWMSSSASGSGISSCLSRSSAGSGSPTPSQPLPVRPFRAVSTQSESFQLGIWALAG